MRRCLIGCGRIAATMLLATLGAQAIAQEPPKPDYPPSEKVLEGYEKVITKPNIKSMYTLWTRQKDGQMYAELPRGFAQKKYFIATTVASGETYAGLQAGDVYVYWRQYDKHLALMTPEIEYRAVGDKEAESSVKRLFTDRVLLEVPIVTMGPGGGPVIDVDAMLLNPSLSFAPAMVNFNLTRNGVYSIHTAKAFENNVEIAFEVPDISGILKVLHYSISDIPDNTGYQPRVADSRVGFFTTSYVDLAKYNDRETHIRYINRWHLEKADPKLQLSPPKNPIVFYIEHTTPVRYRRWVREGILSWNKAYEKVGISDAIEVYYQDAASGAHMDKDPEDVNYNFVRWLNNDIGTAIGPSRVHPLTGQILDADIILTDGWIRHYQKQFNESMPKVAMEGYGPDTLAWLADHPEWDPRIRLAPPSMRNVISRKIAEQSALPYAGHPLASADMRLMGDQEFDGLNRASQTNGMCLAAEGMSFDLAVMKMTLDLFKAEDGRVAARSDEKSSVEGKWSGVVAGMKAANFPLDEIPFSFTVVEDGGALKGSVSFAGMELPLESVTFDSTTLEFKAILKVENGTVTVNLNAKLSDNKLTGSWVADANGKLLKGDFTATRESAPMPTPSTTTPSTASTSKPADEPKPADAEKDKQTAEKKEESKEQMLDGMPETFVGPLIAHLVAHEVGHTLGLRHNFKASSVHTLAEINSDSVKGKQQLAGSVMDYIAANIRLDSGSLQGDYSMTGVGPYDMWAIEYGYTFGDLKPILARVAEPQLAFATDEDTNGPDPLARRYDFSKDPLDFAEEQVRLAKFHRERLLTSFIKDGDSWDRVRYGYELVLSMQTRSLSMMSNWVGGAFVNRDKKGDPNGRTPIVVVPVEQQRKAVAFVTANAFKDEAFGLTPELTTAMGLDKWYDNTSSMMEESTWPIHDRIMGIQASVLTNLLNPTTLKRVHDNESRVAADQDCLTLPEMLTTVTTSIWSELDSKAEGAFTDRKPMISSLRRNLQREHIERLIDLTLPGGASGAAGRAISSLSAEQLRGIVKKIEAAQAAAADKHDAYTTAHLAQVKERITKALDADYILNPSRGGSSGGTLRLILGKDKSGAEVPDQVVPIEP